MKEGHPHIQPATRPGISGLGGRDLITVSTLPLLFQIGADGGEEGSGGVADCDGLLQSAHPALVSRMSFDIPQDEKTDLPI